MHFVLKVIVTVFIAIQMWIVAYFMNNLDRKERSYKASMFGFSTMQFTWLLSLIVIWWRV